MSTKDDIKASLVAALLQSEEDMAVLLSYMRNEKNPNPEAIRVVEARRQTVRAALALAGEPGFANQAA